LLLLMALMALVALVALVVTVTGVRIALSGFQNVFTCKRKYMKNE
jgi:hypothetical protein